MRVITKKELSEILEKHKKWLNSEGGEKADLSNVNLQKFNLRDVDLSYADLRGSDLFWANLKGANLKGADLRYTDLREANLQYADLRGSNLNSSALRCANLYCANLYCADLRDADLRDANLYSTDLRCVYRPWLVYAGNIGSRRSETLYFADYDNVRCGCWNNYIGGTLAEFKERIDEVYPADSGSEACQRYRLEYLLAIKMFESMRKAYLSSVK